MYSERRIWEKVERGRRGPVPKSRKRGWKTRNGSGIGEGASACPFPLSSPPSCAGHEGPRRWTMPRCDRFRAVTVSTVAEAKGDNAEEAPQTLTN